MLKGLIVTESEMNNYINEIKILKEYKNPHILKFKDNFIENSRPCIITSFYKVSLLTCLEKNVFFL